MAHKKFEILEVLLPDDDVFSGHIPHIQQEYPCILTRNQANISTLRIRTLVKGNSVRICLIFILKGKLLFLGPSYRILNLTNLNPNTRPRQHKHIYQTTTTTIATLQSE